MPPQGSAKAVQLKLQKSAIVYLDNQMQISHIIESHSKSSREQQNIPRLRPEMDFL